MVESISKTKKSADGSNVDDADIDTTTINPVITTSGLESIAKEMSEAIASGLALRSMINTLCILLLEVGASPHLCECRPYHVDDDCFGPWLHGSGPLDLYST